MMRSRSQGEVADAFRAGTAPAVLQAGLASFLDRYGFRSVGEIDLGVPRWSEDPTHLIGALSNYLQLTDDALAPDAQFERGATEADAMRATLLARVAGPRRYLLRFLLGRARALMGSREMPKYMLIGRAFTPIREVLRPVGEELAAAGRVERADDIYFLTLAQARAAIGGSPMGATAAGNRATYERERTRRRIPRVLLADGTDAEVALVEAAEGDLRGSPASPGTVTGTARVILSPRGAHLEPGEILVAPSTDPGWTPLFLTAGGLVMEMGGMMSHGAVVAREYGIPAVVGVPDATTRIATGDRITVDGSTGVVSDASGDSA
jgi:pyruvate,water dikinase